MKVQFYILQTSTPLLFERQLFHICDGLYRAYQEVIILCDNASACQHLNDALWTVYPKRFLPHEILSLGASAKTPAPILLTANAIPFKASCVLVNCSTAFPPHIDRYAHVIELVPNDEDKKMQARARYKQYQHPDRLAKLHCHLIQDLIEYAD